MTLFAKFWVALAVLLAGCTTSTQTPLPIDFGIVVSGDEASFAGSRTFAWHEKSGVISVKNKQRAQQASQLYHALVEQQLLSKGYQLVSTPAEADLLVGIAIAQQSQLNDKDIFAQTLLSTGIEAVDSDGDTVEKGSLYIAIYQHRVELPIWKALAQRPLDSDVDEETRQSLATDLVKRMMNSVPTQQ
ncbi:DUF4136 domain-containing protein [Vibrio sp. SCSIO 43135]|uniref:DUF4136 domain-containing protein n=1 Tax=Vibrio sp. SCSIO 43135 TaxID=2819096 RepID=UPI002075F72E|nr:DUF4136 domain-containing protein [Vibrio sp. SCSIO 43135]USD43189.1 DUF4136 domain-containing protein [Vibrio sp. SCSIO 43135]